MEKNLEKSLKRYLKRKVKITLGLVISFLITGMVSFAEENTKADKKAENKKEYIFDEEILRNILRETFLGNIQIIEDWENVKSQSIGEEKIGINNGTIFSKEYRGQYISSGFGINNGSILVEQNDSNHNNIGQNIYESLGVNNGTISVKNNENGSTGQDISKNSLGVNNGTISISGENYNNIAYIVGQNIFYNSFGINNGTISVNGKNYDKIAGRVDGQYISNDTLGINNGIISVSGENKKNTLTGQDITNGTGINNGVIISENQGISVNGSSGTGINNGIIIADSAYSGTGKLYKNGIALKRDDTGKLLLNSANGYNDNVDILEKNGTRVSFLSLGLTEKVVGQTSDGTAVKGYNIFINNLGNETDSSDKDNQLIIDTNLRGIHENTQITTAVTENGYTKDEAVVM